jgi:hypothetical protein
LAGSQGSQFCRRLGNRFLLFSDDQQGISGCQLHLAPRNDILPALADHCDLYAAWQLLAQLGERSVCKIMTQRNLAHMEALRLGRKCRPNPTRHEIDAQDRTNHSKGIGERIAGRRIAVAGYVEGRLQGGGTGQ